MILFLRKSSTKRNCLKPDQVFPWQKMKSPTWTALFPLFWKRSSPCIIDAKNIDLPRKVRYARRKKKKVYKVDKSCRLGRTYADYQLYIREHPDLPVTQIDSVEGRKGGHDINSNPWNFYDADGWEMSYLEAFRMDLAEYELIKQMAEER